MKIAIVGGGVSGLVCAHRLRAAHDVTIFETGDHLGGHTNTVEVEINDGAGPRRIAVDTGFIVFNERNYPLFTALLDELGIASAPTEMSFSYRDDRDGYEYGGRSFAGLFAQKRNVLRPSHLAMLCDIRRFGAIARAAAADATDDVTIGEFLDSAQISSAFTDRYLLPMAGAIWSATPGMIREFPLRAFVSFFENHGMLEPWRAPTWKYVVGGSMRYVGAIAAGLGGCVRLGSRVESVVRGARGVEIVADGCFDRADSMNSIRRFDHVILACHSDQALAVLADASDTEREVLGSIKYQPNAVTLHTDDRLLPRSRAAWSAWNFHTAGDDPDRVAVTYNMNILQRLDAAIPINVTLNADRQIDPAKVLDRFVYHHPVYSAAAFAAQRRWAEISGVRRTHFAGAYWGYGFHEDGVRSAMNVCAAIGRVASRGAAA